MATATPPPQDATLTPCTRCLSTETQTYRVRIQHFCAPCFESWLLARVAKRVNESFRTRGAGPDHVRRILLPISGGGPSSLALLALLDSHAAARRNRSGRVGFEIVVLWIDEGLIHGQHDSEGQTASQQWWEKAKSRFAATWTMSTMRVEQIFDDPPVDLLASLPLSPDHVSLSPEKKLTSVLMSLPSSSSRTDLLNTLRTRLIVSHAQRQNCSIVVWADTTTRLAEKTLAETAKGRGFSLPWQVADGATPFKGIKYMYPLQDMYRKEIELWAETTATDEVIREIARLGKIAEGNVNAAAPVVAVSSKDLTIDDLMRRYFAGVEGPYPSVVTNVVRTAAKLAAPDTSLARSERLDDCSICGLSFDGGTGDLVGWQGNQSNGSAINGHMNPGHEAGSKSESSICYGCNRTIEKAKVIRPG